MKILYAASEAVPFCKTGGLADVAGSLPAALAAQGAEVAVVLPLYQKVKEKFGDQLYFECYDYVDLAWRHSYCGLFSLERDGVTWYFLDNEQYFNRPELYGYMDDGERFGFFSRAVVRMLPHFKFWPDVIHCNDWQTALVPIYLKDDGVREDRFRSIRTVLSVHNIEYQGRYNPQVLGDLFGLDHGWADDGTILMDGDVNLLKGAILCADAVNAVSPTYANELKTPYFAHRLDGIMRRCGYKLSGVLNGIDIKRYDPATDPHIAANYSVGDMSGKQADKAELQRLTGLRQEPYVPIVGMVSRLVSHKGLDLVCEVLHDMMELPHCSWWSWARATGSTRSSSSGPPTVPGPDGCAAGLQRGPVHGHLRRRGPVPDALQERALRPLPDDRHAVRHRARRPGDRRPEGHRSPLRGMAGRRQWVHLCKLRRQ